MTDPSVSDPNGSDPGPLLAILVFIPSTAQLLLMIYLYARFIDPQLKTWYAAGGLARVLVIGLALWWLIGLAYATRDLWGWHSGSTRPTRVIDWIVMLPIMIAVGPPYVLMLAVGRILVRGGDGD